MNPKEYIKSRLNELRNFFPELSFRYKFIQHSSTHIVDVRPMECYSTNQDYIKYEADFSYEFDNLFYPETILFISEGSLTEIKDPDFVFNANQFSEELKFTPQSVKVKSKTVKSVFHVDIKYALAA